MSESLENKKDIIVGKDLLKQYYKFRTEGGMFGGTLVKEGVTKAVDDVSINVKEGDFIAIMGPSGSGKSTLVNLLSTMDTPTSGELFIDGQKIKALHQEDVAKMRYTIIGFVFQDFNLLDLLTCRENIEAPLILNNENPKEIKQKVEEIAEILAITDLLDKYPNQCSGGQKQRVATARAIVTNPKVVVADEPTGNLDSASSRKVMNFFKELNDERDITILMVTHDAMVASYAKKVLYLRDGKIETCIERENKKQRDFFDEVLELVSEDAVF